MSTNVSTAHATGFLAGSPSLLLSAETSGSSGPGSGVRSLSCFIVEDSPVIQQNLVATLNELLGMHCVGHAEDEAGALAWLDMGVDVDLLIIDIFLKSGTGLEVLRRARAQRPGAHMVVLTNYATAQMRRHCLQLGADRVFDKSAELEDLIGYCESLGEPGPT